MKNILVVNDDGINAIGIVILARHAAKFGRVSIVAPEFQCSGKSQSIIVDRPLNLKWADLKKLGLDDAGNIELACSLDGTPADCVRFAVNCIVKEKPDLVFSGINQGYNTGVDLLYSGTVGAAMQALTYDIPAIAFSIGRDAREYSVIEENIDDIIEKLLAEKIPGNEMWNVNFPQCPAQECKGILFDRKPDSGEFTKNVCYQMKQAEDGSWSVFEDEVSIERGDPGSDKTAVQDRYISIGKIRNMVLDD